MAAPLCILQAIPLALDQFGELDDGFVEVCWLVGGGQNPWRLSFYVPLAVTIAFAAFMMLYAALASELRSSVSRSLLVRKTNVIAVAFCAMWAFP